MERDHLFSGLYSLVARASVDSTRDILSALQRRLSGLSPFPVVRGCHGMGAKRCRGCVQFFRMHRAVTQQAPFIINLRAVRVIFTEGYRNAYHVSYQVRTKIKTNVIAGFARCFPAISKYCLCDTAGTHRRVYRPVPYNGLLRAGEDLIPPCG